MFASIVSITSRFMVRTVPAIDRRLRDHVVRVAGLDAGDAQHRGVRAEMLRETIDCSACRDGRRPAPDRCSCCGCAPCAPLPVMMMSKNAPPAARDARAGDELAHRQAGTVVHAVDRVAGKTLEQPVLQHLQRAAEAFLGRLEDEVHRAVEVARLRQVFRRAQQHRGVAVMAAGVHPARVLAGMGSPVASRIGSASMSARSPTEASRCRSAARRRRRSCRRRDAPRSPIPPASRPPVRGSVFLQPQFRMGVDVAADGGEFVLVQAGTIERGVGHQKLPGQRAKREPYHTAACLPERESGRARSSGYARRSMADHLASGISVLANWRKEPLT